MPADLVRNQLVEIMIDLKPIHRSSRTAYFCISKTTRATRIKIEMSLGISHVPMHATFLMFWVYMHVSIHPPLVRGAVKRTVQVNHCL